MLINRYIRCSGWESCYGFDSPDVKNRNLSGIRYFINLRCKDSIMLQMDFTDQSKIIQMGNDYYKVSPEIRDELLNYVKITYVIKETK